MKKHLLFLGLFCLVMATCQPQQGGGRQLRLAGPEETRSGAEQTGLYFPQIEGKKIGVVCNQTSLVGNRHLIDTLLSAGIRVEAIFSPEHGFRGDADAGQMVGDDRDDRTGIRINSLYGRNKKPSKDQLAGIDVVIFDIQDVGTRFFTYISTLSLVMEACSEAGIPLVVLDRPNPNGFYIDGPVLDTALRSFVGMHPVPVVYGMTIGEYALMVNGEGWLGKGMKCNLKVVPMDGYDRNAIYRLPVRPSPNLPNWQAVYLYPSLCFLEGTIVSVGRGTDHPFQLIGHPAMSPADNFSFMPRSVPGASIHPPFEGQICNGKLLITYAEGFAERENHLSLSFLIESYKVLSPTHVFFTEYFDLLAGNAILKEQISKGLTESEIRATWKEGLESFKAIRKQYLCYPDI